MTDVEPGRERNPNGYSGTTVGMGRGARNRSPAEVVKLADVRVWEVTAVVTLAVVSENHH